MYKLNEQPEAGSVYSKANSVDSRFPSFILAMYLDSIGWMFEMANCH